MYHDEIPERCKLNFTGIVDDALRIAGELFPKQTLKNTLERKLKLTPTDRVRSRRFEKKEKSLKGEHEEKIMNKAIAIYIGKCLIRRNEFNIVVELPICGTGV
ncbi:hypothetical protein TNCV_5101271 [Trichonephila clavipes]|nr:hypothetical protein TNCV_5101271 [Trichonephila clavipes]